MCVVYKDYAVVGALADAQTDARSKYDSARAAFRGMAHHLERGST